MEIEPFFIELSKIYSLIKKDFFLSYKFLRDKIVKLNKKDIDITINFNFSKLSSIFNSLIDSRVKFGATLLDSNNIFISNRYLRELFFDIDNNKNKEHILNYFFKALNVEHSDFYLKPEKKKNKNFTILIHPGASEEKKKWGIKNYLKLIKLLKERINSKKIKIIITGGRSEIQENLYFEHKIRELDIDITNFTGKLKLNQLLDIINHCDLILSSDTSIAHLGALTLTKSITIYLGGTYHYHTFPYQYNKTVIYPEISCYPCKVGERCQFKMRCKKFITPEMIISLIEGKKVENSLKTVKKDRYFYLQE